jgi:hypothetical protein
MHGWRLGDTVAKLADDLGLVACCYNLHSEFMILPSEFMNA